MEDEYPTCAQTFVTLRIYPERLDPTEVTARLGIEPSSWQRRGEDQNPGSKRPLPARLSGWFLSSEGAIDSRDCRPHLDWLLAKIGTKAAVIQTLLADGCRMDVSCFWLSRSGHGGPTVTPLQMGELARLGLDLWFDVYFASSPDAEPDTVTDHAGS
jgi:hypothetical protein